MGSVGRNVNSAFAVPDSPQRIHNSKRRLLMIKGDAMYSIIYHKPEHLVRLKWLGGTAGMTDGDFKETLESFAETAIQHSAKRLLIDVSEFKHRPSPAVGAWRDEVIVPKYNRAGVEKIAWVWPMNTPSNGPTSEKDKFENRYFATEAEALAWASS